jgi:hypothetical protein
MNVHIEAELYFIEAVAADLLKKAIQPAYALNREPLEDIAHDLEAAVSRIRAELCDL